MWSLRTAVLLAVALAIGAVVAAPAASAGPNCPQVYPWSEVCKGNAGAVVCYFVEDATVCALADRLLR